MVNSQSNKRCRWISISNPNWDELHVIICMLAQKDIISAMYTLDILESEKTEVLVKGNNALYERIRKCLDQHLSSNSPYAYTYYHIKRVP